MRRAQLKALILRSLREQGFRLRGHRVLPPRNLNKKKIRDLHASAVRERVALSRKGLIRHESRLLRWVAAGTEVEPERIRPRLVEVEPGSEHELLFRYARLHWSVPVSAGYGRRLRFLVIDEQNQKLIGVLGLCDPVFSLSARDMWVGWDREARKNRLHHVMEAFVLGAVPPYTFLLCGKLVALLASSNEVRDAFRSKYAGSQSLIRRRREDGRLALITTASALGRSSIYNRLKYRDRHVFESVGFSRGSGEFHFSNGLYGPICDYAARYCDATAKVDTWGTGFRNRREVIRKCLKKVGLPTDWLYHGIRREVFVVPLARNTQQFLRGEHARLYWFDRPLEDLFEWFRERWLLPRAQRDSRYVEFNPRSYRLWSGKE